LPIEGGLEVAFKRALAESSDAAALKSEITGRLEAVRSPFRTAESFLVEEIVDPVDTRPLLCEWAEQAYASLADVTPTRDARP
jgi:propionyl-CoA carboxylase beta chain